jgi:diguanylate cyclase (GGDEF)-like protein
MFPRLRRFASDQLEAYLSSGPSNVNEDLALSMRRARGFSLIGQGVFCVGAGVGALVGVGEFVVLSAISMLVVAGNVRLGAVVNGRYFNAVTQTTFAMMLAVAMYTAIKLDYASPFGVLFSVLIIMSANYILGTRSAIFWTSVSIAALSYQVLASNPVPFPPDAIQPTLAATLVSRIVVLVGTCAIAVAERSFSDRQSRELAILASRDSLTGLLNRRAFQDRLRDTLARAERHGRRVGIIFLDLDEFKQVNDQFGHAIGDAVLQQVGRQIAAMTRQGDAAARTGGDEFVMLLEDIGEAKDIRKLAERMLVQIQDGIDLSPITTWALGVSVGAACFPDDATDSEALMHVADQAMYRAKRSGGAGVSSTSDLH